MNSLLSAVLMLALLHKPIVGKYEGGRRYRSRLILTLFSDSTFTYSVWHHNDRKIRFYKGTWQKASNKLILTTRPRKPFLGKKTSGSLFRHSAFTLKADTLKLYSEEDSVKDYRFYKEYYTLLLQR